jgi:hypothetical protein
MIPRISRCGPRWSRRPRRPGRGAERVARRGQRRPLRVLWLRARRGAGHPSCGRREPQPQGPDDLWQYGSATSDPPRSCAAREGSGVDSPSFSPRKQCKDSTSDESPGTVQTEFQQVNGRPCDSPIGAQRHRLRTTQDEKEGRLEAAQVHRADERVVVDLAEHVVDRQSVVAHRGGHHAAVLA